jgi:DNA mismatch repair protein MutL
MSIQALPLSTTYVLGSCQVLTTPVSLVKELIDNAIDAKAASIDVIISANTLDRIEVRDSGTGISPDDLDALGRRGYTSKLRTLEDLKSIGGLSLGFRGEALASAVELGDVSITTRIEGEATGIKVKLKRHDGIDTQSRVSHPVGTTVCVTSLFSRLPVRKHTSLKDAPKTISKIKDMLQSYALARLNLRISFKVLQKSNANWSFAPRPKDGIKEATYQIMGKATASECFEVSIHHEIGKTSHEFDLGSLAGSVPSERIETITEIIIHAFLPKPNADFSKIKGSQFAAVDSRPISCARGIMKKIISSYKTYIRYSAAESCSDASKSPFICLNIICPIGSYDPNIEPSKDDILFENEDHLICAAEKLFKAVYGDCASTTNVLFQPSQKEGKEFDLLLARRKETGQIGIPSLQLQCIPETMDENRDIMYPKERPSPQSDKQRRGFDAVSGTARVSGQDFNCAGLLSSPSTMEEIDVMNDDSVELESPLASREILNPWVIAKMYTPATGKVHGVSALASKSEATVSGVSKGTYHMQSPVQSIHVPRRTEKSSHVGRVPLSQGPLEHNSQQRIDLWMEQQYNANLGGGQITTIGAGIQQNGTQRLRENLESDLETLAPGKVPTVSPSVIWNSWRPLSTPKSNAMTKSKASNKPFVLPLITPHRRTQGTRGATQSIPEPDQFGLFTPCSPMTKIPHPDVEDALDFERRKEIATRRLRKEMRNSRAEERRQSSVADSFQYPSHSQQYNDAIARIETSIDKRNGPDLLDKSKEKGVERDLPHRDPRAYLMRRQKSIANYLAGPDQPPRLKRAKTMLLPFETIPETSKVHDLVHLMVLDLNFIKNSVAVLSQYDEFMRNGAMNTGIKKDDLKEVESSLNKLLSQRKSPRSASSDD